MKPFTLFAIVQPGLESFAAKELENLQIKKYEITHGGIEFNGHITTIIRIHAYAKTISRVLIRIDTFHASEFWELEKRFQAIDLSNFLHTNKICIRATSVSSTLFHEDAIIEKVTQYLQKKYDKSYEIIPSPTADSQTIYIYVNKDSVMVSIDCTGIHLYKRGYMLQRAEAPLRETIAAAMIQAVPINSVLCDPFCGTGTIPIEFATQNKGLLNSQWRTFSYQNWANYDPTLEEKALTIDIKPTLPVRIIASDLIERNIESARHNAKMALVEDNIRFSSSDYIPIISKLPAHSVIITNPPYGVRLQNQDILQFYRSLFSQTKPHHSVYCLIPDSLLHLLNLRFKRIFSIENGGIAVSYIKLR